MVSLVGVCRRVVESQRASGSEVAETRDHIFLFQAVSIPFVPVRSVDVQEREFDWFLRRRSIFFCFSKFLGLRTLVLFF